jgi:hypothetical protein
MGRFAVALAMKLLMLVPRLAIAQKCSIQPEASRGSSTDENRWDGSPGSGRDAVRSQVIDMLKAQIKRRPASPNCTLVILPM